MHWCSYLENPARGWRIKDPWDQPYADFVEPAKGEALIQQADRL
jgi:hypothetical protein